LPTISPQLEAIMTRTGTAAVTIAIIGSAFSLVDAVYGGITGHATIWDDASGHRWAIAAVNVLLIALFAVLVAVVVQQADRIDGASRPARWIRRPLLVDLAVLAGVFVIGTVLGRYPAPVELVAGIAFMLMFLLGAGLGLSLLRRRDLRVAAILLSAPLALIPVAALVDALAPGWGHPGYAESALYLGLAILARKPVERPAVRPAPIATEA
jgi:hypothetical protein